MWSLLDFVDTYRVKTSSDSARVAVASFLEYIYGLTPPPRQRDPEWYNKVNTLSLTYLKEERDYGSDLFRFSRTLDSLAPYTMKVRVSCVKMWLEINDIEIRASKLKLIRSRMPKARSITKEQDLTIETIRSIFSHLKHPARGIFFLMLSSGMRIGEVVGVDLSDLNLEERSIIIPDEITKTKIGRTVFFSMECAIEITEWLKVRDKYKHSSQKKAKPFGNIKRLDDTRLFPITTETANMMFKNACRKAGVYALDEQSHRATFHPHMLRKFFISQLKAAGMPEVMVEILAGHTGYLNGAYDKFPKAQLREAYQKHEFAVSLSGPNEQVRANEETIKMLTSKLLFQDQAIAKIIEMQRRYEEEMGSVR